VIALDRRAKRPTSDWSDLGGVGCPHSHVTIVEAELDHRRLDFVEVFGETLAAIDEQHL
jgi:hypothetical protein